MNAPMNLAAAQNMTPEFYAVLSKLGLEVVIVLFEAGRTSPIYAHADLAQTLGQELLEAHAGQYDSTFFHPGEQWLFFHAHNLSKAMQQLKASLDKRGLLGVAKIMHAESPNELRTWWPATAETLVYDPAADSQEESK